jgi:leader peptidase (prepilin peptidase)/N-methyltransferase
MKNAAHMRGVFREILKRMWALVAGLFGLIVGSFLNVLVLRRATGHSVVGAGGEGSACASCGHPLCWLDMVPVVSWFLLGGRCRYCESAVSAQYPLVEALTAFTFFLLAAAQSAPFLLALSFLIASLLIAIAAYDIRHTIIPNEWVWPFAGLSLLYALTGAGVDMYALLAGPFSALPLFALWFVSRGAWMGFGDVKLALGMGWLLGPVLGPVSVVLAFVLGALVSIFVLLPMPLYARVARAWGITRSFSQRSYTMKSEVPFGPFLIASTLLTWFLALNDIAIPLFPYV